MLKVSLPHDTDASSRIDGLIEQLRRTRSKSIDLIAPLTVEDMTVQVMEDASPSKWHLAHTTWFFETFVLKPFLPNYKLFDEAFNYCFNSYYEAQGVRQPRHSRGVLTRPTVDRVLAYRRYVDEELEHLFQNPLDPQAHALVELGVNHEQQHQELLLMDILALFAANPLRPAYKAPEKRLDVSQPVRDGAWSRFDEQIVEIGHQGTGFHWDNEQPHHKALLLPFRLANDLVTCGEWIDFITDGGYRKPALWLAEGWAWVKENSIRCPNYWEGYDSSWHNMTLHGVLPVNPSLPVCNISYYEADAYARWVGKRLPTEFEWEFAARQSASEDSDRADRLMPARHPVSRPDDLANMFGAVWQWTQSSYSPYPSYRPPPGAIGEYNGKFMVSQQVLRGSSFATPIGHSRSTYRNFFYPSQRWQFAGLRLASDV